MTISNSAPSSCAQHQSRVTTVASGSEAAICTRKRPSSCSTCIITTLTLPNSTSCTQVWWLIQTRDIKSFRSPTKIQQISPKKSQMLSLIFKAANKMKLMKSWTNSEQIFKKGLMKINWGTTSQLLRRSEWQHLQISSMKLKEASSFPKRSRRNATSRLDQPKVLRISQWTRDWKWVSWFSYTKSKSHSAI